MSSEAAQTVFIIIVAIGTVVWLIALMFLVTSNRPAVAPADETSDQFAFAEPPPKNWSRGSAEVDAPADTLVEKAAAVLVKASSGSLKIAEKSRDRLTFERVGPGIIGLPDRGELLFSSLGGNRTRIDYAIEPTANRALFWVAVIVQVAGLVALVAGGWTVYEFCVLSQDPVERVQTVQMVQVVHLLWPPFLFGGLYRARKRIRESTFWQLLSNLPKIEV